MKKLLLVVVIAGIALVAVSAYQFLMRPGSGDVAPDFTVNTLSGEPVSLQALRGRPVLIVFWASFCGICREELPQVSKLAAEMAPSGLSVLAISVDDDRTDAVVRMIASTLDPALTVLRDPTGVVADAYQSFAIPDAILVNREGTIVWRSTGPTEWSNLKIRELVK